jgi:hypothetical protein
VKMETPAQRLRAAYESLSLQAEAAEAVAAHFRPRFDGLRDAQGRLSSEQTVGEALMLMPHVTDREREARRFRQEANDALLGAIALEKLAGRRALGEEEV